MRTIIYNKVTLKAVPGDTYSCEGCYFNRPGGRCSIAAEALAHQCYPSANAGNWIIWTEVTEVKAKSDIILDDTANLYPTPFVDQLGNPTN